MAESDLSRSVAEPVPVPTLVLSLHHRCPLSRWGGGGGPGQQDGPPSTSGTRGVTPRRDQHLLGIGRLHTGTWGWGWGLAHSEPLGQALGL